MSHPNSYIEYKDINLTYTPLTQNQINKIETLALKKALERYFDWGINKDNCNQFVSLVFANMCEYFERDFDAFCQEQFDEYISFLKI